MPKGTFGAPGSVRFVPGIKNTKVERYGGEALRALARDMREQGRSPKAIASYLSLNGVKLSVSHINKICEGILAPRIKLRNRGFALLKAGLPVREVANYLQVSLSRVSHWRTQCKTV